MKKEKVVHEWTCDRCRKTIENGEIMGDIQLARSQVSNGKVERSDASRKMDLCTRCSDLLENWLNNEAKFPTIKQQLGKAVYDPVTKNVTYISNTDRPIKQKEVFTSCLFDKAWIGPCKKPTKEGFKFCDDHLKEKCFKCKKQATKECDFAGQFVCGMPTCDKCRHEHRY